MINFKVTGLDETIKNLGDVNSRVREACEVFITRMIQHITYRAQQNAPIKSGDLRNTLLGYVEDTLVATEGSGNVRAPKTNSAIITGQVLDLMEYAVRMHEGLYGLGVRSASQPNAVEGQKEHPGQPVGRKYISSVVDFHLNSYINGFKSALLQALTQKGDINLNFFNS